MNAREFKALFERATQGWPQEDIDYCQTMIRADWIDGPGWPRDHDMPDHMERRQMWIDTMRHMAGEYVVPVNEKINEQTRASIQQKREAEGDMEMGMVAE